MHFHQQAPVLARHMRRRTTSHKSRRMPAALKNANRETRTGKGENSPPSKPGDNGVELPSASKDEDKARCRKHRRRPRAMLAARSPHAEGLPGEGSPARYGITCRMLYGKWYGMLRYGKPWCGIWYDAIRYGFMEQL